ncbi:uncharacterized protein [Eurosta solidaginis]|uniref:uncharacterized protein n=1 Tax=Eurosta solidaginis TaxID=178769 RepID=UPI0035315497
MLRCLNFTTTFRTLVIVLLVFNVSWSGAIPTPITQKTTTANNSNQITLTGVNSQTQKDGLTKRNVKVADSASYASATAKSYDPPPEYYRGTNSASKTQTAAASDSGTASFVSKPVTFPDNNGLTKYSGQDLSQKLASTYDKWQQLQGQGSAQERISVKPFGGGDSHGISSGYTHGTHSHYVDYGGAGGHGGYYGQSAEVAGGIPLDLYGGGKGSGQYVGNGGEYSYTYPEGGAHEPAVHKDWHHLTKKDLLAKSFLIPLAGAAVLGIAAAFISHPWLLQLGAVSGAPFGATVLGKRRRRRDLSAVARAVKAGIVNTSGEQANADGKLDGADIAYRAYQPKGEELE